MYRVQKTYQLAKEPYVAFDVDLDQVLSRMDDVHISMHCWQWDDVIGFEPTMTTLGGGLAVTGHYPGKAQTPNDLCSDLEKAFGLIPGDHRLNLQAIYSETGESVVERDRSEPQHFEGWMD